MKKKSKPRKKKNPVKSDPKLTDSSTIQSEPNPNRPSFQETWKSEIETENKEIPKKYGLLKKLTNILLRIDPKISSGDLIPKGEISAARQKMESELGEKLTQVRNQNPSRFDLSATLEDKSPKPKNKKLKANENTKFSSGDNLINIKELLPQIKDSDLDNVLKSLSTYDSTNIMKKISTLNYPSFDQFYSALGEEICGFLNDFKASLNYKISVLRKNGGDDDGAELQLMSVPLKIKLFRSSLSKPDFDKVMSLLNEISKKIRLQETILAEEKAKPKDFVEEETIKDKNETPSSTENNSPQNLAPSESPKVQSKKKKSAKNQTKKKKTKKKSRK